MHLCRSRWIGRGLRTAHPQSLDNLRCGLVPMGNLFSSETIMMTNSKKIAVIIKKNAFNAVLVVHLLAETREAHPP